MNTIMNPNEVSPLFMEDIEAIDFTMVKQKLQDEEEGLGWSTAQCNEAEADYKKFLALKRTYPEKEIVPNKQVDLFWHQHILDTQKYAEDCENIFGYFLHHFPYFGMSRICKTWSTHLRIPKVCMPSTLAISWKVKPQNAKRTTAARVASRSNVNRSQSKSIKPGGQIIAGRYHAG